MALSPCIKICVIDPSSEQCKGCYRTLREIAQWGRMNDDEHKKVLTLLAERKKTFTLSGQNHSPES